MLRLYKNSQLVIITDSFQVHLQSQRSKLISSGILTLLLLPISFIYVVFDCISVCFLTKNLDVSKLDVDNIDLIGTTDHLQFILSRTCQQLANVIFHFYFFFLSFLSIVHFSSTYNMTNIIFRPLPFKVMQSSTSTW